MRFTRGREPAAWIRAGSGAMGASPPAAGPFASRSMKPWAHAAVQENQEAVVIARGVQQADGLSW